MWRGAISGYYSTQQVLNSLNEPLYSKIIKWGVAVVLFMYTLDASDSLWLAAFVTLAWWVVNIITKLAIPRSIDWKLSCLCNCS
jgi:hypothetical protein